MYLRILKKDLKRKKTMNCILLLFVILSSMFASSSVNNIVTVMNGLDGYFEKAEMSDYFFCSFEIGGNDTLSEVLENESSVTEYRKEPAVICIADNFTKNGEKFVNFSNTAFIISPEVAKLNYFDSHNDIITEVEPGKVYISGTLPKEADLHIGDTFELSIGDTEQTFEYAGIVKDAFLGADMINNPRLIINNADYQKFTSDSKIKSNNMGAVFYVDTNDTTALEAAVTECSNIAFNAPIKTVRTTYSISMIVAGILLVVSICLILVSFVVLRFTIGFTISEEFHEIGVMKAVGLKNNSIRGLYLVKYLGIAVVGTLIGYIASIPFGNMLIASVSEKMVLGNDNSLLIGILCSIAVVAVILLFCWSCTRKIKKMSPIDAVRSGQTGERFRKRSFLHLGKSHFRATPFLALNDVISEPKQYGIITAVFSVCIMLVMILANIANTLASDKLLFLLDCTKSDAYYTESKGIFEVMTGAKSLREVLDEMEKKLADNGMPADVHIETLYQIPTKFGDTKTTVMFQLCNETKASDYTYTQGTPPQYSNEIALSEPMSEKLDAHIGDTLNLTIGGKEDEYIITALYQSFNQLGESGRLNENVFPPDTSISSTMCYQIDFTDNPDSNEIDNRIEKLKKLFDTDEVTNAAGYVQECTGASDIIGNVKNLMLVMVALIVVMIIVLMERSFIAKEKPQIALMKAMGFKNRAIVAYHTARFVIVCIAASVIAMILCASCTKLIADPIFAIMGAVAGISYEIRPLEVFIVYPLVLSASAAAGAFFTSLYTKSVKASDTSNIE